MSSATEEFQNQVHLLPLDETDTNTIMVEITPLHGPYQNASFTFKISSTDRYPDYCPEVTCLTPVFHPNINSSSFSGNICLNILNNWHRAFGLKELLHAIIFLFYEPNFDDPYGGIPRIPDGLTSDEYIKLTLRGEEIDGFKYHPNEAWCKWASETGILTGEVLQKNQQSLDTSIPSQDAPKVGHQVSVDFFHPVVQSEFENVPSLSDTSRLDTVDCDYGLCCSNVTISCSLTESDYIYSSRYYYVMLYDSQNDWNPGTEDYGLPNLLPSRSSFPVSLQRTSVQPWLLKLLSNFRYTWDLGFITNYTSPRSSIETSSLGFQQQLNEETNLVDDECQSQIYSDGMQKSDVIQQNGEDDQIVAQDDMEESNEKICIQEQSERESYSEDNQYYEDDQTSDDDADVNPSYDEVRTCSTCEDVGYWLDREYFERYRAHVRHLKPLQWIMYKTNWPLSFSPGNWYFFNPNRNQPTRCRIGRASIGQLRGDINYLSKNFPTISDIILVDPLALSPLSPILNRFIRVPVTDDDDTVVWTSVEWLSPSWALNPPPYPPETKDLSIKGSLPITFLCLLSNWLAYGSRIETYNCLGYSRRLSSLFFDSLGITCLTPAQLSYGSTLLFDGWPLWLGVQTTRWLSSILSRLLNRSSTGIRVRTYHVFTDVDEI